MRIGWRVVKLSCRKLAQNKANNEEAHKGLTCMSWWRGILLHCEIKGSKTRKGELKANEAVFILAMISSSVSQSLLKLIEQKAATRKMNKQQLRQ